VKYSSLNILNKNAIVKCGFSSFRWMTVRLEFLGSLIIFAAAVFAVSARETVSPAIIGLSVSSALQVTQLLGFFVRIVSDLESNIVSVERMNELATDTPQVWIEGSFSLVLR
jgi:ATP-binding cassette subfamily C (CFTR/MRP) protein 1